MLVKSYENSEQKGLQGEPIPHSLLLLIKIIKIWQETLDRKSGETLERLNMILLFIRDNAHIRT